MMKVFRVVLLLIVFVSVSVKAQKQVANVVVRFENLTVEDRLPSHRVLCVCQDQRGFMWFGTEEGLCRYDGFSFMEFFADNNDPYSLKNNAIRSIVEDRFGNLWIGTDGGGLHYFDQESLKFFSLSLPFTEIDDPRCKPGIIYAILRTRQEHYWIGSYGQGLYNLPEYDSPQEIIEFCESGSTEGVLQILPNGDPQGLNDLNVFCLYEDSEGVIWIGTDDYGSDDGGALHKMLPGNPQRPKIEFQKYRARLEDGKGLGSNYIMSMYEDSKGRFWVSNWEGGLNLLNRKTGEVIQFRPGKNGCNLNCDDVYGLTEDANGNLWLATYGGGISRIEENEGQISFVSYVREEGNPYSLIGNYVRQIFRDQTGLLWAITWKSGISKIRVSDNPFLHIPLPGHTVEDTVSELVHEMRYRGNNRLALFTEKQGYFDLDLKPINEKERFRFSPLLNPKSWPTEPIYETSMGKLFAGQASFENVVSGARVFFEDSKNRLWLGKEMSLYCIDLQESGELKISNYARNSQNPKALKGYQVTGIVEDQSGQIWVSTFDALNLFDENKESFNYFTMKNGLPGNAISGMLIDSNNFIWLATENGLARFDPGSFVSQNYSYADGLPFEEFAIRTGYGMEDFQDFPAFYEMPDGTFVFSSIHYGLLVFNPDDVYRDFTAPNTWITEFRILNQVQKPGQVFVGPNDSGHEISYARNLILGPKDQSFSFTVSVLDYFNSQNARFSYRLKPVDDSWHYLGAASRVLTFSLLPPGEYLLEVRGANSDGVWNSSPTQLGIHIPRPWWSRLWFRSISFTVLFSVFIIILIRARQRSKIVQALHLETFKREELDRFTQMRMRFYTNVTHEFRTLLTLILGPLGKIERISDRDPEIRSDVSIMKRNGLRLLNLVNQLMDFRKLETKAMQLQVEQGNVTAYIQGICDLFGENILSREIDFVFQSNPSEIHGLFDRSAVDKIVFNLLSNAFKHTEKRGRIEVHLDGFRFPGSPNVNSDKLVDWVRISVVDHGPGIPENIQDKIFNRFFQAESNPNGSGIGLSIVESLTEMHKGSVKVRSKVGQGCTFVVEIPIGREAFLDKEVSDRNPQANADFSNFRPSIIRHSPNGSDEMHSLANQRSILVVEDNPDMQRFISGILAEEFRVWKADSAESALALIDSREPDLILSDVLMPGIGGFELVRILRIDPKYSHIPVVLISALEGKEAEIAGLRLGAVDFIHKPFEPDVLLAKVQNWLNARALYQRQFMDKGPVQADHLTIGQSDQDFLNELMGLINRHYQNPAFNVKDLVDQMSMSHSVLFRKVKALTGQNLTELIIMIRLEKAHSLLTADHIPVKEVAYQVGFSDPKYFSTRFKKKFGKSPSEIRL